ncbi:MAG: AAA family ATPase [Bacilli bacterium]
MSNVKVNVTLEKQIFLSDNGYQIAKCVDVDSDESHMLVGHFLPLKESQTYSVSGVIKEHTKYGEQIEVTSVEKYVINDCDKLVDYLSGGLFFGIGKVTAQNIVDLLGESAIEKILDEEEVLYNVKNFSIRKAKKLSSKLRELNDTDNAFNLLLNAGFSQKIASKIYSNYGDKIKDILSDDPFVIYYEDPYKYRIKAFYDVCRNLNIKSDDLRYIAAKVYEYINEYTFNTGDTYVTFQELEIFEDATSAVEYLKAINILEVVQDKVMIMRMYEAEKTIAHFINQNAKSAEEEMPFDFSDELNIFCKSRNIMFSPEQENAIKNSFLNKISIITGGPGTGKTTIISAICKIFINAYSLDLGDSIFESELVLLAPTGRAAKRMNEQTMISSATIHRYLKWDIGNNSFEYNKNNKSNAKVVIIDEVSMIDTYLFSNLIDALREDVIVILIGDDMQLSSVGSGDILHDIIKSEKIYVSELNKVYRQDDDNLVSFMHDIRNFEIPKDLTSKYINRNFIMCSSEKIYDTIYDIVCKIKNKNLDIFDFQFLVPMYKGLVGIDNINKLCQSIFNEEDGSKKECTVGKINFRVGDKVIITKNYPNENVYNGDLGIINNILYKENKLFISILFESRSVEFTGEDLYSIAHGYAISIHKSQGSEFKHVILPITIAYSKMLKHNLIYTGITRAKDSLLIVGQESIFVNSVCNNVVESRRTNLVNLIKNSLVSPFDFI